MPKGKQRSVTPIGVASHTIIPVRTHCKLWASTDRKAVAAGKRKMKASHAFLTKHPEFRTHGRACCEEGCKNVAHYIIAYDRKKNRSYCKDHGDVARRVQIEVNPFR